MGAENENKIERLVREAGIEPKWVWDIPVGDRTIHVVRTPDGYKKLRDPNKTLILTDPETGEAIDTGIRDATENNLEDLTPEELAEVEKQVGRIPSWWERYLLDHPKDFLLILLLYRLTGGDMELLELITRLKAQGFSAEEIIMNEDVLKHVAMAFALAVSAATLAKLAQLIREALLAAKTTKQVMEAVKKAGYFDLADFWRGSKNEAEVLGKLGELEKVAIEKIEELLPPGNERIKAIKEVKKAIQEHLRELDKFKKRKGIE